MSGTNTPQTCDGCGAALVLVDAAFCPHCGRALWDQTDRDRDATANAATPIRTTAVGAGTTYSIALRSDGSVVSWGHDDVAEPGVVPALSGVVAISAGLLRTYALTGDGALFTWSPGREAQVRTQSGVAAVAAQSGGAIVLMTDGTIVHVNEFQVREAPSRVHGARAVATADGYSFAINSRGTVDMWSELGNVINNYISLYKCRDVVAISARDHHAIALTRDGVVYAAGSNEFGQRDVPIHLGRVVAISAGGRHVLGLLADGTVTAWGDNGQGQCDVPSALSGVTAVAAGLTHSLALQADGEVVCWGNNSRGQLNVPTELLTS